MAGRLEGKVAIITGGASGMGLATAKRFVSEGAKVVVADLNADTGATALESIGGDAQGWGESIVNTASIAGMSGGGGPLCYSAAKAAVINLTRAAALELAEHRIRVNAIAPGTILTPLMDGGHPERTAERLEPFVPWPDTVGRPDDIANAALYLAGDEAGYVTGETLVVDGGMTAAGPRLISNRGPGSVRPGYVGVNRGTTGEGTTVRQRPS